VGVGDSPPYREAAFVLRAPVPSGSYAFIGDGIIAGSTAERITVRLEARLRPQSVAAVDADTDDTRDVVLASVENEFLRDPNNRFAAVPFSATVPSLGSGGVAGDRLVYRFTALRGDPGASYILNGDGVTRSGRIPRLDLPPSN
jgi:hypothetical protein